MQLAPLIFSHFFLLHAQEAHDQRRPTTTDDRNQPSRENAFVKFASLDNFGNN
jgi:hypothetical protein